MTQFEYKQVFSEFPYKGRTFIEDLAGMSYTCTRIRVQFAIPMVFQKKLLLFCMFLISTQAQFLQTEDRTFHILFGLKTPNRILVTTRSCEPVSFSFSSRLQANVTYTVSQGDVLSLGIPNDLALLPLTSVVKNGMEMQSKNGKDLIVAGVNQPGNGSLNGFLVFPKIVTKSQSYEYYALIVGNKPHFENFTSYFSILIIEPNTTITITPAIYISLNNRSDLHVGSTYHENILMAGSTIVAIAVGDVSGSRVMSDKPITFSAGHDCGSSSQVTECAHIVQQIPPTETWGFKFFLVPLTIGSTDGYRILASKSNTDCTLTCTNTSLSTMFTLINVGNIINFNLSAGYCSMECKYAVLLFQFSLDGDARRSPFTAMVTPVGQYSNHYDIAVGENTNDDSNRQVVIDAWMNVVIPSTFDPAQLTFDSGRNSCANFTSINCGNREFCGQVAQCKETFVGTYHKLRGEAPFYVTVYGWEVDNQEREIYAFATGMKLSSIAAEIFCFKQRKVFVDESKQSVRFNAIRTGDGVNESCVQYSITDITTQGKSDYKSAENKCCFIIGQKETNCEISLVDDSEAEGDEVFRIQWVAGKEQLFCDSPGNAIEVTVTDSNATSEGQYNIIIGPNLFRSGAGINPELLVTTSESDPVKFWVAWDKKLPPNPTSSNTTHIVSHGGVVSISIPLLVTINSGSPQTPDIGIQLRTQNGRKITVVVVNEQQASTDAFLAFPKIETKSKTYEYFALSVTRGPTTGTKSFFGLVTIEPQTTCTITTVVATRTGRLITNPRTGTTFALATNIAPGHDHTVTAPNEATSIAGVPQSTGDMSGTRVVCDKPVSFITGHQCGFLPSDKTACDHMVEQVPPTETWGFKFFLVPLSTRNEDGYRILSSMAGTECGLTCIDSSLSQTIILANPGSFVQRILTNAFCCVECNRPVLIFQYSLGHSNDWNSRSDPFIVMIPPVGQYSNDYDLIFFESKALDTRGRPVVFEAWINIAIPVDYEPSDLRLDNSSLKIDFKDITCSSGEVCGRVAQYLPTSRTGAHKLVHTDPNAKFMATVYGWERENSYGYIGGMNFESIAVEIFCMKDRGKLHAEADVNASFVITRSGTALSLSCIDYTLSTTQDFSNHNYTGRRRCCFAPVQKKKACMFPIAVNPYFTEDIHVRVELSPTPDQYVCDEPRNTMIVTIADFSVNMLRYARDKYMVNLNLTDHVDIYLVASQPFSMNTTVIIALENDTATLQYVNVTFVTGSYVSTGVNVKMLIEQNDEKITYSASEQLRVTFEVPPGYTNLSKAYPQEAVIVRQSTMINISGSTELIPSSMAMSNSLTLVAVTIAMATLAVILCSVIGCIIFIYIKRRYRVKKASSMTPVNTTLHHPTANLPNVEESWELKHSELAIQGHLGTGQFGDVVLAFLKNTTCTSRVKSHVDRMIAQGNTLTSSKVVAVKFLKDSIASDNMNTFLKEVDLMIKVSATGNNHIVQIVGCILTEQPMAMVMEYVPFGDLHSNLIQWKEQLRRNSDMVHSERNGVDYAYSREALEDSDLLSFGRQISLGMKYLASMKVIHRDLASRNILVGHGKHLKIADFGLSKEIDGLYASSSNTKLPIRWMSPETITHRLFSEKSDVWSFGVCLWEICTLGEVPYGCFSNTEVAKMIASGKCLARPKTCSKEIYDLMVKCWAMECSDRPYFEDVVNYFTTLIENSSANANYIALNEITGDETAFQSMCQEVQNPDLEVLPDDGNKK